MLYLLLLTHNKKLEQQTRKFAQDITDLLNGTITNGIRLRATADEISTSIVGYQISKHNPLSESIPLTLSKSPARFYLNVIYTLTLDNTNQWLTAQKSTYTLQQKAVESAIFTYDYTRGVNEFPEAHLHVYGKAEQLQQALNISDRKRDKPRDFHLPVGNRRFRPCVEDIIEFCVLEKLVKPRHDWQNVLNKSRDAYFQRQLKAAVKCYPETAAQALRAAGWNVNK